MLGSNLRASHEYNNSRGGSRGRQRDSSDSPDNSSFERVKKLLINDLSTVKAMPSPHL